MTEVSSLRASVVFVLISFIWILEKLNFISHKSADVATSLINREFSLFPSLFRALIRVLARVHAYAFAHSLSFSGKISLSSALSRSLTAHKRDHGRVHVPPSQTRSRALLISLSLSVHRIL